MMGMVVVVAMVTMIVMLMMVFVIVLIMSHGYSSVVLLIVLDLLIADFPGSVEVVGATRSASHTKGLSGRNT